MINLEETFKKYEDQFVKSKVEPRDFAAFELLNKLCPCKGDIVAAAGHDQIWLGTDIHELELVATEEDIEELVRLGVLYEKSTESLYMFV